MIEKIISLYEKMSSVDKLVNKNAKNLTEYEKSLINIQRWEMWMIG